MKTLARLTKLILAGFVSLFLMGIQCMAQEPAGSEPASSNVLNAKYPKISSDLKVTFKIKAPEAQSIQIDLGKKYNMIKDDQGTWSVTTDPQVPGFHYYSLVIDGVAVADPASESFFGMGRMASGIEIPEKGVDFYNIKDVPHGDIRLIQYFSNVTNSWRKMYLYTPPGYDSNIKKKYPVLYIQHGGGEDERGWVTQGKTNIILDNLIAEGKAKAMLVVIANGNVTNLNGYNDKAMDAYADEMIKNVIPFIEKNYRVIADREHRAIAGLSMGGGQAFYTGLRNTGTFSSIGVFSSGIFGGIASTNFDAEKQIPGILTKSDSFNKNLKLFYLSVGEQDPRFEYTKKAVNTFRENHLKVTFSSFPGAHEWQTWRKSLHEFASLLFK
jgi:enterochelin esterase-like enzyme